MFAARMMAGAIASSKASPVVNEVDQANAILLAPLADPGSGLDMADYSPLGLTLTNSGATWQTSVQQHYGGAAYFDGGDIVSSAINAAYAIGTGDFAIGFWARFHADITSHNFKAPFRIGGFDTYDGYIGFKDGSNLDLYLSTTGSGWSKNGSFYGTVDATTWHFYSLARSSGTIYTGLDGTVTDRGAMSGSLYQSANKFVMGCNLPVYMQDIRIFNTAKWTSNFTPPGALITYP